MDCFRGKIARVPKEGNSNSTTSLEAIKKKSSNLDPDPAKKSTTSSPGILKKSRTPSLDAVKTDSKSSCTESTMVWRSCQNVSKCLKSVIIAFECTFNYHLTCFSSTSALLTVNHISIFEFSTKNCWIAASTILTSPHQWNVTSKKKFKRFLMDATCCWLYCEVLCLKVE